MKQEEFEKIPKKFEAPPKKVPELERSPQSAITRLSHASMSTANTLNNSLNLNKSSTGNQNSPLTGSSLIISREDSDSGSDFENEIEAEIRNSYFQIRRRKI